MVRARFPRRCLGFCRLENLIVAYSVNFCAPHLAALRFHFCNRLRQKVECKMSVRESVWRLTGGRRGILTSKHILSPLVRVYRPYICSCYIHCSSYIRVSGRPLALHRVCFWRDPVSSSRASQTSRRSTPSHVGQRRHGRGFLGSRAERRTDPPLDRAHLARHLAPLAGPRTTACSLAVRTTGRST